MAITVGQLAVHLRIQTDPAATVAEPDNTVLTQLLSWANGVVDNRTTGASEAAKDQAVVLLAGYQYDKPPAARGAGYADAWSNSGASNVLRKWTHRRGVILEGESTASDNTTVTSGIDEAAVQTLIDASIATHAALPNVHHTPPARGGVVVNHHQITMPAQTYQANTWSNLFTFNIPEMDSEGAKIINMSVLTAIGNFALATNGAGETAGTWWFTSAAGTNRAITVNIHNGQARVRFQSAVSTSFAVQIHCKTMSLSEV